MTSKWSCAVLAAVVALLGLAANANPSPDTSKLLFFYQNVNSTWCQGCDFCNNDYHFGAATWDHNNLPCPDMGQPTEHGTHFAHFTHDKRYKLTLANLNVSPRSMQTTHTATRIVMRLLSTTLASGQLFPVTVSAPDASPQRGFCIGKATDGSFIAYSMHEPTTTISLPSNVWINMTFGIQSTSDGQRMVIYSSQWGSGPQREIPQTLYAGDMSDSDPVVLSASGFDVDIAEIALLDASASSLDCGDCNSYQNSGVCRLTGSSSRPFFCQCIHGIGEHCEFTFAPQTSDLSMNCAKHFNERMGVTSSYDQDGITKVTRLDGSTVYTLSPTYDTQCRQANGHVAILNKLGNPASARSFNQSICVAAECDNWTDKCAMISGFYTTSLPGAYHVDFDSISNDNCNGGGEQSPSKAKTIVIAVFASLAAVLVIAGVLYVYVRFCRGGCGSGSSSGASAGEVRSPYVSSE